MTPRLRPDIKGDNVSSPPARFGDEEPQSNSTGRAGACRFCNQGEGARAAEVAPQFKLAVRDSWRKARLVDLPQGVEIFRPVVTQGELHWGILDCLSWWKAQTHRNQELNSN